jgi:hypothetical protein
MKYLIAFLFVFATSFSFGQNVKQCQVFQLVGSKGKKKKLVLTQTFNKKGKLTKEVAKDYILFLENSQVEFFFRDNGVYEYQYSDTLLKTTVEKYIDDITGDKFDSGKTRYYYSKDNRLVKEIKWQNLKLDTPGKTPWSQRDTILYRYDDNGLLTQRVGAYGDSTREFYEYDTYRRVITDSVMSYDRYKAYCRITKYEYRDHGYTQYDWLCNRQYPIVLDYVLDDKGRVIEQRTLFHKDEDRVSTREDDFDRASFTLSQNQADYKLFDKTVTEYNAQGRIAKTTYYYNDKPTTTHVFVYK